MSEPYRVIVAGSRHWTGYDLVRDTLDALLVNRLPGVVILSGAARGVDALGERYAAEHGLPCERHPADWGTHGRAAGPIRNETMAKVADACVVFDAGGPGSASMRQLAEAYGLALRVVRLPGQSRGGNR